MTTPFKTYEITDPKIESTSRHESYMNMARKLARTSSFPGSRMGSVVVRGGRVISTGVNKARSGFLKDKNYTRNQAHHAELDAVLGLDPKLLRGATVYVAGFTPSSRHGTDHERSCWSSKCCESCQAMLRSKGIRCAIFHDRDNVLYVWKVS